jgi:electron transport complex protein RnfC
VLRGKPLTHRVVSVTGSAVRQPKNLLVPIGISYRELLDFCGGLTTEAARIISGGPMMGFAFANLDAPVTKGTSAMTVLKDGDVRKAEETACIRCGRCVDACPMNLVPTKIALASRAKDVDLAQAYHIMACFECGCCAFTCPASIPLVQLIRTGKAQVIASQRK